jgi:hypothetical protein
MTFPHCRGFPQPFRFSLSHTIDTHGRTPLDDLNIYPLLIMVNGYSENYYYDNHFFVIILHIIKALTYNSDSRDVMRNLRLFLAAIIHKIIFTPSISYHSKGHFLP